MNRCTLIFFLLWVQAGFSATGGPDDFGYTFTDSNETNGPDFQWIAPTSNARAVVLNGSEVSSVTIPPDGIGAPVDLGFPLTLYGTTYTRLVPCANGYLSGDPSARGLDNTPDCPIPNAPDLDPGGLRLYPFHADLGLKQPVYYEYFEVSPHPHACFGVSVFTWEEALEPDENPVRFQVLLFDNGDILFQYAERCTTREATVGIQDFAIKAGLAYTCGSMGIDIPAGTAILFEPPILIVDTSADQLDTPAGAQTSLREAVRDIPAGGKILLQTSNALIIPTNGLGRIHITKPLSIDGSKNTTDEKPVLSGEGVEVSLLRAQDALGVTLRHLIIRDAAPTNPTSGAVQFVDNTGSSDFLSLCDVDFVGNRKEPALYGSGNVVVRLNRCRFIGNMDQGALYISGGVLADPVLRVYASEFSHNASVTNHVGTPLSGGAIRMGNTDFIARNCSFFNNSSWMRGGAVYSNEPVYLYECTFSENRAKVNGGALTVLNAGASSTSEIRRCTFVNNSCDSAFKEGLFGFGPHTLLLERNILSGTTVHEFNSAVFDSTGYNLSDVSLAELDHVTDIVGDPKLGPLGPYGGFGLTHLPLRHSAAIDAGGPATAGPDQRGYDRPLDGDGNGSAIVDIGAVEAGVPIEVNTAVDEDDGINTGDVSLRDALNAAGAGQHIVFDSALSGSTITLTEGTYQIGPKAVHIDASDLPDLIRIDASNLNLYPVFSSDACISFHGVQSRKGGRFTLGSTSVVADRCVLSESTDMAIGTQTDGDVVVDRCVLHSNLASPLGLGGYAWNNRITGSWFYDNTASGQTAAGVSCTSPGLYIANSTFSNNRIEGSGGVIRASGFVTYLLAKIQNTTFSGNRSDSGGALKLSSSRGHVSIDHCTFYGHRSATGGAAIAHTRTQPGLVTLRHTLFARNVVSPGGWSAHVLAAATGVVHSAGFNLTDTAESEFDHPDDILNREPHLSPLAWHNGAAIPTHYPLARSPAIDAGFAFSYLPLQVDALGQNRITDGLGNSTDRIDIGAVEAAEPIFVTTHLDELNTPSGASVSLREALRDAEDGGRIVFEDSFFPAGEDTVDLFSGLNTELTISQSVLIDATGFHDHLGYLNGITVSGPSASRIFDIDTAGHDLSMHGVSLRNGNAPLADPTGGALRNIGGRLTMTHSAIYSNNAATDGGAVILNNGQALFENVTLYDNSADDQGGAVFAFNNSSIVMQHSTVAYNRSGRHGAGFHLYNTDLDIYSSIVGENQRPDTTLKNVFLGAGGTIRSRGYNLSDTALISESTDIPNTTILLLNALTDAGGLAHVLVPEPGSVAVDQGPILFYGPPSTDARGLARPYGPRIDIGAYELGSLSIQGFAPVDVDRDTMDDWWEFYYFGTTKPLETDNGDGDLFDNGEEYENETNPRYANNPLEITDLTVGSNQTTVIWNSSPHVVYQLFSTEDLPGDHWEREGQISLGEPLETSTEATPSGSHINDTQRWFKIEQY